MFIPPSDPLGGKNAEPRGKIAFLCQKWGKMHFFVNGVNPKSLVAALVLDFLPETCYSQVNIYNKSCKKLHWSQCIARCVESISRKTISNMYSFIDSVGCVMFVEKVEAIKKHMLKSMKSSKSSLYHFLEFFRTRVLDTHEGYLKSP